MKSAMSAFGPKRTSVFASHVSALRVKQTSPFAVRMSAFDPKRISTSSGWALQVGTVLLFYERRGGR
jgi:hypothetical protein